MSAQFVAAPSGAWDAVEAKRTSRQVASPLDWKTRMPRRVTKNTWYFIEDNTIPDFQAHLQKFAAKGHGEVRCSAPTRRLLDSNPAAQRELIGTYGKAAVEMPRAVFLSLDRYATKELRAMRRSMDPTVQLREAVDETLADLMRAKPELSSDQMAELVAKYNRVRDRFAQQRREFAEMEDAFELMQAKLVQVLGGVE